MLDLLPGIIRLGRPLNGGQEDFNIESIFQHRVETVHPFSKQDHLFSHCAAQPIKGILELDIQFLG